ncbi:MAG: MBL fold metallo-hydrolase [Methanolinea sp.]|nr:MAG: MBL fold metallo-hydrolase [Methanolinea sp.]
MGQDGTFIRNAESLGQDLARIKTGILSHGHYDHGGGLGPFLEYNARAPVYLKERCNEAYYARDPGRYRYIGLDAGILSTHADRFIRVGTDTWIAPGLMLIANIQRTEPLPPGNSSLLA